MNVWLDFNKALCIKAGSGLDLACLLSLALLLLLLSCFSRVQLFMIPWTVALQAPLSMGFLQARIQEWVVMSFSRGSSQPRDWTLISCFGRCILYKLSHMGSPYPSCGTRLKQSQISSQIAFSKSEYYQKRDRKISVRSWVPWLPDDSMVKNQPANAGDTSGRSPGGANGNPLQYSCLRNPMDRGAWQTTVHRVVKSQTRLKRLSTHLKTMDNHNTGMPQLPESIHSGSSLSGHVWNWEKYGELEFLGCQSEYMQSLG